MQVIHTVRKGKSVLLFSPYFELLPMMVIFRYKVIQTLIITLSRKCHVDGAQRAWATCDCTDLSAVMKMLRHAKTSLSKNSLSQNQETIRSEHFV